VNATSRKYRGKKNTLWKSSKRSVSYITVVGVVKTSCSKMWRRDAREYANYVSIVCNLQSTSVPHRYGNSHAVQNHTVLPPAIRYSRLYPVQLKLVLVLAIPERRRLS